MVLQLLVGTPQTSRFLASCLANHLQLASTNVVDHAMDRQAALVDGFLDRWVQSKYLDRLLDVELCDPCGACVVTGKFVQLGLVLSSKLADGVEPGLDGRWSIWYS